MPNEILLQILKDMYPPGAFKYWASSGPTDETIFPPLTGQTPGWTPARATASASYTEIDRCRQYFAALEDADMAVQSIATMNHHFRGLSRDILVLRAAAHEDVLPSLRWVPPDELTWKKLVGVLGERDRDIFVMCTMVGFVEYEKLMKAREEWWRVFGESYDG